jgi:CRISPR-associated protein Cmr4
MPDAADGVFLYVETALHAGTSQPGRVVDLPIQRDDSRVPVIPGSTLRGGVLATARKLRPRDEIQWAFGLPPDRETDRPGVLVFTLSRPVLFPVRTYKDVFAWITSPKLLSASRAAAEQYGLKIAMPSVTDPGEHEAVVAKQAPLLTDDRTLIIEDFSFPVREADEVSALGQWLAGNAVPQDGAFAFFRDRMEKRVVVLSDDTCDFLLQHRTPVVQRAAIDPTTGTVQEGALWTEESLPSETLLFTVIVTEKQGDPPPVPVSGISWLKALDLDRLQVGANRTLSGGLVRWTWLNGG